jgi:hypothetical protein
MGRASSSSARRQSHASKSDGNVKVRGQRRHHNQSTTSRQSQSPGARHTSSSKPKSTPLSYVKVMASVNVRVIVDVNAEFRFGVRRHTPRVIAIRQSQTSIVLRHSQRRGPRSQVRSHRSKSESDVRRFMPASEVTGIHTTQMSPSEASVKATAQIRNI